MSGLPNPILALTDFGRCSRESPTGILEKFFVAPRDQRAGYERGQYTSRLWPILTTRTTISLSRIL